MVPNTSRYVETLVAEENLTGGIFILENQPWNKTKSLIYTTGAKRSMVPKREHDL